MRAKFLKLNKVKCEVLHFGQGTLKHKDGLDRKWNESDLEEDSGFWLMRAQCELALSAQKSNCILGCIRRQGWQQSKGGDCPLLFSLSETPDGELHLGLGPPA